MIYSMTGFGKAQGFVGEREVSVEIKTLNSKHGDINVRLPSTYKGEEIILRKKALSVLSRGKIDLIITETSNVGSLEINEAHLLNYYKQIGSLFEKMKLPSPPTLLADILKLPDVLQTPIKTLTDAEKDVFYTIVEEALLQVNRFREKEGEAIQKDFEEALNRIEKFFKQVSDYEKERIDSIRERLTKNLEEDISITYDKNRLEQEIIFYIEKLDMSEECSRLHTHINYFREILQSAPPNGKKLGFLLQEIGREINTMGSKCNHSAIQKLVVSMKDELEKMKEQVLNVL